MAVVQPVPVEMTPEQYKQYHEYVAGMSAEQKTAYDAQLADMYEYIERQIERKQSQAPTLEACLYFRTLFIIMCP